MVLISWWWRTEVLWAVSRAHNSRLHQRKFPTPRRWGLVSLSRVSSRRSLVALGHPGPHCQSTWCSFLPINQACWICLRIWGKRPRWDTQETVFKPPDPSDIRTGCSIAGEKTHMQMLDHVKTLVKSVDCLTQDGDVASDCGGIFVPKKCEFGRYAD